MTTEMHPLTLAPARRAELVSGFQAAFSARPDPVFLRSRANGNWRQPYRPPARPCPGRCRQPGYRGCRSDQWIAPNSHTVCRISPVHSGSGPAGARPQGDQHHRRSRPGRCRRFVQLGCPVAGFDAYVTSTVLPGSGLSSSAAFEVLLGTVLNCLFFERKLTAPEIAMAGQYGENVFFGKPSGLMDQMACAVGNLVAIDFLDPGKPAIHPVAFDFAACGHALCIVDSRASPR